MRTPKDLGTLANKRTATEDDVPVTHLTAQYYAALAPRQKASLFERWMLGEDVIIQGADGIDRDIDRHTS